MNQAKVARTFPFPLCLHRLGKVAWTQAWGSLSVQCLPPSGMFYMVQFLGPELDRWGTNDKWKKNMRWSQTTDQAFFPDTWCLSHSQEENIETKLPLIKNLQKDALQESIVSRNSKRRPCFSLFRFGSLTSFLLSDDSLQSLCLSPPADEVDGRSLSPQSWCFQK